MVNYLPKSKFIISMEVIGQLPNSSGIGITKKSSSTSKTESSLLSTKGHIRRKNYFKRLVISSVLLFILINILMRTHSILSKPIISASLLIYLVFIIIQVIKRLHDVGKSGWSFLIPIYGPNFILQEGTIGENKYGEDPKKGERLTL